MKLPQPIQMELSKKLKIFRKLFTAFLKFTFNFEYVEKKGESHSLCLSGIEDCEVRTYVNV